MENWQPVPGWEGIYEVSDQGRVQRIAKGTGTKPGRLMNPCVGSNGYALVHFRYLDREHSRTLHGLVAEVFIGPRPLKSEVNHLDGNKSNNRVDNLEYVSRRENLLHSYEFLGRSRNALPGERNHKAKLTEDLVREIRRRYASGDVAQQSLADEYAVGQTVISSAISRRTWRHVT